MSRGPATRRPGWHVEEFRGPAALRALESDWTRLYASMPARTSAHAHETHVAFADLLMAAPGELRCLVIRDGEHVKAICPLEAATDRFLGVPLKVWAIPRFPHVRTQDLIGADAAARRRTLPMMVEHLGRRPEGRRLLVLGPAPADSALWAGVSLADTRLWFSRPVDPSDVFDCTLTYDELTSRLSKHFRRNLRSHRRKLTAQPEFRTVHATEPDDVLRELDTFMRVEASGWKGANGSRLAVQLRPKHPAFYVTLAATLGGGSRADRCEINALYSGERCLASQFCTRTGSEYQILKIAYDEEYRRLAPGLALLETTLERCCEDPDIERVNLLTDGPWQRDWHPDLVPLRQEYFALDAWAGRTLVAALRFRAGRGHDLAQRWRAWREHAATGGETDKAPAG